MSMSTKDIIILGTGGNCIDILDMINDINAVHGHSIYTCRGFLDDDDKKWGMEFHGVKVLGPLSSAHSYHNCYFVNGIGSPINFWRKDQIIRQTSLQVDRFETFIHPTASVSRLSKIGKGVVVFPHVTITSNTQIGMISYIGTNTSMIGNITIGDYCLVGMGSIVLHDVLKNTVVAGNPARVLRCTISQHSIIDDY
jgi:acetyltransferase EpsM